MTKTLNDIAKAAGVSVSTVSRVVNNKTEKYRISNKTKKLVIETAKKLNYRPNELARGLRLKKTHTIGLIVPDIANPFFSQVTRIIQTKAYQLGYSLIVCNTDENVETEIAQIELLRSKGIDGFILMPVGSDSDHIKKLLNSNFPIVLLDRCFDELRTNSVVVDNYKAAYNATEYLLKNGHRKIAIIQGIPRTYTSNARLNGYLDALKSFNVKIDEQYIVGKDFRRENGYIETKLLLNLEKPPTAIFTTSDLITLGALQAIFEERNLIPNDISIVSFDDIDFGPYLISPLTAVSQPKEMMGEMAVKLLLEDIKLKGKSEKKRIVLPAELIVRKSVRMLNKDEELLSVVP